jgi:hypothetical protein
MIRMIHKMLIAPILPEDRSSKHVCTYRDSNSDVRRHMALNHTCKPIPAYVRLV